MLNHKFYILVEVVEMFVEGSSTNVNQITIIFSKEVHLKIDIPFKNLHLRIQRKTLLLKGLVLRSLTRNKIQEVEHHQSYTKQVKY